MPCSRRQSLGLGALLLAACRDRADAPDPAGAPPVDAPSDPLPSAPRPGAAPAASAAPAAPASRWQGLPDEIRALADEAIERREVPGAVVQVSHRGEVVLQEAYGCRSLEPAVEAMTVDTLFDLASLTKPVATATVVHVLAQGRALDLREPLRERLPELRDSALGEATAEHLLLHTSGLEPDLPAGSLRGGAAGLLAAVASRPLASPPGQRSRYSDTGYQLLGELAARAGRAPLGRLFADLVAAPLGAPTLTFAPPPSLWPRAAPTAARPGGHWRGEAHDPSARALGGAAGHAGLFGTADDLDRFCRMLLAGGLSGGRRVLPAAAAAALLAHRPVPSGTRTLGWDVSSGMLSARGDIFPARGAGHLGFTGTSIWIDPPTRTSVTLLTSRLHPSGRGDAHRLQRSVGTAVGRRAMTDLRTGLDEALAGAGGLRGRRVGLLTHAAAVDAGGRRSVDALRAAGVEVVRLFSPEHGLEATHEGAGRAGHDRATGLPVVSMYGNSIQMKADHLDDLDALVIDLQDAGCRFYTYLATSALALEGAARRGRPVVVLDRPNPLGGEAIEGPTLDAGRAGALVAYHPLPVRHGLTLGEALRLVASERGLPAPAVVAMAGWRRAMRWPDTGLTWRPPSPSLRGFAAALLYPGVGLLELTNLSVGRGTSRPFEQLGAPWMDGARVASALSGRRLPGLVASPAAFTPASGPFAGERCGGVSLTVTDPAALAPLRLGAALAVALRRLHASDWRPGSLDTLLGHRASLDALLAGDDDEQLLARWQPDRDAFAERRRPHLLYA